MNIKLIKKSDILIILSIIIISLILLFIYRSTYSHTDAKEAEITVNGNIKYRYSLNENKIFSLSERPNIEFEISEGKIHFLSSDCPDKVCIKAGYLSNPGQTAACLPNKISVRIIGKNKDKIDS